ncbi:MAG: sugar ABC transporter permease [Actinomycetota bacterium]
MGRTSRSAGLAWFIAPALAGAGALVVVPALFTLVLAFTHYDGLSMPRAAGFENFRRMSHDVLFWTSLRNSLIFAGLAVPARLAVALGVGLLVAPRRAGVGAARTAVVAPTFVPDVAYALLWMWVFNPLYGPLAAGLRSIGLPGTEWLLGPWGARTSVVIISLFQVAEAIVVVAAVRNQIPRELYEAALVEGSSAWHTFRRLTLPLLTPVLVLLAARDVVFGLQSTFVPALVLTEGGPNYATTFLPLYTYQNAFEFLRFGYAAAMTIVMFAVTAAMIAVMLYGARLRRAPRARRSHKTQTQEAGHVR